MVKKFRKYLIPFLSFFLILSNFSFAVNYSICNMGNMKEMCFCSKDGNKLNSGLIFSKKPCCEDRIVDLSNSNTLSIDKSFALDFILTNGSLLLNNLFLPENYSITSNLLTFHDKIPKDGIPITNSSILI